VDILPAAFCFPSRSLASLLSHGHTGLLLHIPSLVVDNPRKLFEQKLQKHEFSILFTQVHDCVRRVIDTLIRLFTYCHDQ
jgi:hypothetical protein